MQGNALTGFYCAQRKARNNKNICKNLVGNSVRNSIVNHIVLVICLLPFAPLPAFSQSATDNESLKGFTSNLSLEVLYDDNIRRTSSDNKKADTIINPKPELQWLTLFGKHQLHINYKGDYGYYSGEDDLDYDDHSIKMQGLFDHSRRLTTELELGFKEGHDAPGSTNVSSITNGEFNIFTEQYAKGTLYYGKKQGQGQLALRLNHNELTYRNNEQEFRDHERDGVTVTFFYRMARKTRLFFETAFTEFNYEPFANINGRIFDQSNTDTRYLAGVEWRGTAKTTGTFRIGQQEKEYESTLFTDISGLTLSLDMIWKPNTYTTIKIGASRATDESAQVFTNGFVSENINADLTHALTSRTTLRASIRYGDEEFANTATRNDKREEYSLGLEHKLRRYFEVGTKVRYALRDSNQEQFNFLGTTAMLYFNLSID